MSNQTTQLSGVDLLFGDEEQSEVQEPVEPTETEGDANTDLESQTEEETAPDELDDESEQETDDDESGDDSEEGDEQAKEAKDSDDELFVDLDGEEVSLETIKAWKKANKLESHFTKLRKEDAKREKCNQAEESRLQEQSDRLSSIAKSGDDILKRLRDDGFSDEEITSFNSNIESIRKKVAEDRQTSLDKKFNNERELLLKRNKDWLTETGEVSDKGNADTKLINDYIVNEGFIDSDMDAVYGDHKIMIALHKAAQFDALKRKTVEVKKKVKKAPVTIRPKSKPKAEPKIKQTAEEAVFGL